MPHLDEGLDVVITDDGRCTKCRGLIPKGAPGGLCAACIAALYEPPKAVANQAQIEARRTLAQRELARRHLVPYMQYMMPGYQAGWVHYDIAARLERFLRQVIEGKSPRLLLAMPPRHGKQISDHIQVLTTAGWKKHGDLKPGDEVFGPDGLPTRVVQVHPPGIDTMEVETTDGAVIQCHENHEWTVYDRSAGAWRTLETKELAKRALWSGRRGKRGGRAVFHLPARAPLQLPERALPLHPYFFGVWLGDGNAGKGTICYAAQDAGVLDAVAGCGWVPSAVHTHRTTGVKYASFRGMVPILRRLGVLGDKHIPEQYKLASIDQREQLLAGLIDTDGHVEQRTQRVRIATVSDRLAADIEDLVRGLGWRANCYTQAPALSTSGIQGRQPVHYVSFTPDRALPTRVPRKRVVGSSKARRRIGIADVRRAKKPAIGRCISVARSDGLYLVGRELVPTHNSLEASQFFPAWSLGKYPWLEFIDTSHTLSLAIEFSRKVRAQLEDPNYHTLFEDGDARVDPDNRNAAGWKTLAGGGYLPAGVGGAIVGRGAHIGIIDDFLKNREQARSATVLNNIMEWYTSTFYTRLAPGGGVLVIATRWVGDDLIGRLIEKMHDELDPGDQFDVVSYPAIAETDEYRTKSGKIISIPQEGATLLRKKGEALHPERWPIDRLEKIKAALQSSPGDWEALYQQNPTSAQAAIFQEADIVFYDEDELPKDLVYYSTWDLAIGQKERNDYSVGLTGGVDIEDNLWLVDLQRGRWSSLEIVERIINTYEKYNEDIIGIEKGHIQMAIGPFLEKRIAERQVQGMNVVELPPGNRDKVARSRPIQGRMQQRKVRIPRNAPWVKPFLEELLIFTGVGDKRDDQVDVFAWLGILLAEMSTPGMRRSRSEPKWMQKVMRQIRGQERRGRDWRAA